ncbi:hypothetical protein [Nocardiopsis sp. NRRL B-16309]|uniref:hypothetical protein n=1 Tax=Nocardiopsis sp. NRRL B-16309 TaxID=1519494 RepID=UPI0018D047A0|nr:hypothetical protein [Nocardiopsis sp. NRRL B-16309]
MSELFATFNEQRAAQKNPQGSISEKHRDLARAAIVFTAAGVDACLRTLLRDALETLLREEGSAHSAFKGYVFKRDGRFDGDLDKDVKDAIAAIDPRAELIALYVEDLTKGSIQGSTQLGRCRKALGIDSGALTDEELEKHDDFFCVRNQVAHELDLIDPSGKGSRGRQRRDVAVVGRQCDEALLLVHEFIKATARKVQAVHHS